MVPSRNRTRATLEGGESTYLCDISAHNTQIPYYIFLFYFTGLKTSKVEIGIILKKSAFLSRKCCTEIW